MDKSLQYKIGVDYLQKSEGSNQLSQSHVAAWCAVNKDGYIRRGNQACHGDLRSLNSGDVDYIATRIQQKRGQENMKNKDDMRDYIDWLINDGNFACAFAVKDPAWVVEKGVFIATPEAPSQLMAGGIIASRRVHEMSFVATTTARLRRAGMDGNLAFLIAHNVVYDDQNERTKFDYCNTSVEHTSFEHDHFTAEMIKNWVEGTPKSKLKPSFRLQNDYWGYKHVWGERGNNVLLKALKAIPLDGGDMVGAYVNPFAKSMVDTTDTKRDWKPSSSLVDNALKIEKILFKKFNINSLPQDK